MTANEVPNWLKTLPNKLTLARMGLIPIIVLLYPIGMREIQILCGVLFWFAAVTDFFDGYIARRYNIETAIGAVLDPISDKLLITCSVILLTNSQLLPTWIACVILSREMAISALRLFAKEYDFTIAVSQMGKVKTSFQGLAIFILLLNFPDYRVWGMISLWISIVLSYWSAWEYFKAFWERTKDYF